MEKRGISPVIATTMLIGLVIILGVIIAIWFSSFTKESIVKFDRNIDLACSDVNLEVNSNEDLLEIYNRGTIPVSSMKIIIEGDGFTETKDIDEVYNWPANGLNPGSTISLNSSTDLKKIILIPVLIGASESGKKEYQCSEDKGYAISF